MDTEPTTTTHTDQPASATTRCQMRLATLAGNRKLHFLLGGLAITALLLTGCEQTGLGLYYWDG